MLTFEEVAAEVERIRAMAGDDERAHSAEDDLWEKVLIAVAEGHPDAAQLALVALRTKEIDFARWCA